MGQLKTLFGDAPKISVKMTFTHAISRVWHVLTGSTKKSFVTPEYIPLEHCQVVLRSLVISSSTYFEKVCESNDEKVCGSYDWQCSDGNFYQLILLQVH